MSLVITTGPRPASHKSSSRTARSRTAALMNRTGSHAKRPVLPWPAVAVPDEIRVLSPERQRPSAGQSPAPTSRQRASHHRPLYHSLDEFTAQAPPTPFRPGAFPPAVGRASDDRNPCWQANGYPYKVRSVARTRLELLAMFDLHPRPAPLARVPWSSLCPADYVTDEVTALLSSAQCAERELGHLRREPSADAVVVSSRPSGST